MKLCTSFLSLVAVALVTAAGLIFSVSTQTMAQSAATQEEGKTQETVASSNTALLDPNDSIILLLDHQTGLFQTVKDIPIRDLRANTVALAKMAELAKVPVLTTASEPKGPNGPLMPELAQAAPHATYIPRKGEISAWDNEDFRKAVKDSGKNAHYGRRVDECVCCLPALQAKAEGYTVYAVMDASGDMSEMASRTTLARLAQAGIIPVTTNVVLGEFQRTWNRSDAASWGALYSELVPHYQAVTESYKKALEAAVKSKK